MTSTQKAHKSPKRKVSRDMSSYIDGWLYAPRQTVQERIAGPFLLPVPIVFYSASVVHCTIIKTYTPRIKVVTFEYKHFLNTLNTYMFKSRVALPEMRRKDLLSCYRLNRTQRGLELAKYLGAVIVIFQNPWWPPLTFIGLYPLGMYKSNNFHVGSRWYWRQENR